MNLIASIDNNWHLGNHGELLFRVPADLQYFRARTLGQAVVLGRKTLATFPRGEPLAGRDNIILTRDKDFRCAGAQVAHSLNELFFTLRAHPDEHIWVIGGAEVYCQLLPYCRLAYITRFEAERKADCRLPNLDTAAGWRLAVRGEEEDYAGLRYRYLVYENSAPRAYRADNSNN